MNLDQRIGELDPRATVNEFLNRKKRRPKRFLLIRIIRRIIKTRKYEENEFPSRHFIYISISNEGIEIENVSYIYRSR